MPDIVLADTSCLIVLDKIGELNLLKTFYKEIYICKEVFEEYGNPIPEWIKILERSDGKYFRVLETLIDKGEAGILALALENKDSLTIIDDLKARNLAKQLNIKFTGTLGVIVKAKQKGIILSVKPILNKLKDTNFRINSVIEKKILELSGE